MKILLLLAIIVAIILIVKIVTSTLKFVFKLLIIGACVFFIINYIIPAL